MVLWLYKISLKNMDSSYNSFPQFSRNLVKSKLTKLVWSCKAMWPCKYFVILESKVKFYETYMKMSKYENSLCPYSLQISVNLPEWKLKDTDVILIPFLRLFTERITPEEKGVTWQILSKLTIFVRNCDAITRIRTFLFVTSC